jgi:hypothetical protein
VALACDHLADRLPEELARLSTDNRSAEVRARARAAVVRLGAAAPVDWLKLHLADLRQARSCAEKREAIAKLKALGDRRALPDLRRMYHARYGFLGRKRAHACVHGELGEVIDSLAAAGEGSDGGAGGGAAGRRDGG